MFRLGRSTVVAASLFATALIGRPSAVEPGPACAERYGISGADWKNFDQFLDDIQNRQVQLVLPCLSALDRDHVLETWGSLLLSYSQPRPPELYLDYFDATADTLGQAAPALDTDDCRQNLGSTLYAIEAGGMVHADWYSPLSPEAKACVDSFHQASGLVELTFEVLRRARKTGALSGREPGYLDLMNSLATSASAYVAVLSPINEYPPNDRPFQAQAGDGPVLLKIVSALADAPELKDQYGWAIGKAKSMRGELFAGRYGRFGDAASLLAFAVRCLESSERDDADCKDEERTFPVLEALIAQLSMRLSLERIGEAKELPAVPEILLGRPRVWSLLMLKSRGGDLANQHDVLRLMILSGLLSDQRGYWSGNNPQAWMFGLHLSEIETLGGYGSLLRDPSDALDAIDLMTTIGRAYLVHQRKPRKGSAYESEPLRTLRTKQLLLQAEMVRTFLTSVQHSVR